METVLVELQNKLKRKAESRGFEVSDEDIVDEINDAILFVNCKRGFVPTSERLFEEQYSGLIVNMALSAIAKYGAEGQSHHNENGISRIYENGSVYPETLIMQITPLARGV